MSYLLLDVKNRDVHWNSELSSCQCSEKSGFTDTVLTDKTISATISQGQAGICQDSETTNSNIDALNLDILALLLSHCIRTQLQWIDLHEELLVRLGIVWLVQQLRSLVLDSLELLLVLLGCNLPLRLLELLAINLRLNLSSVRRLQIHAGSGDTESGGHIALCIDGDGVVQSLCRSRCPVQIDVRRTGRAELLDPFLDQPLELCLILLRWISGC